MLANLLAVIVGLGSLGFYLAAFILPEVHRRSDFFWSGVGMFYAVVLWYCARQMNGAVLLGQTASVGLLLWLGYQTLLLRRETTPPAQQTPIRLGKAERSRLNGKANRPIAKDYEFVEDGVEDAVDQEPASDSPILIKPTADEFAPKMVVPAAMPQPSIEEDTLENSSSPVTEKPADKTVQKKAKPNPIAAVGIFVGWLKEVVTPTKKEPKPMIELPPRPPSIPKSDMALGTANTVENSAQSSEETNPLAVTTEQIGPALSSTVNNTLDIPRTSTEEITTDTDVPPLTTTSQQEDNDEDSNWPNDDFWD